MGFAVRILMQPSSTAGQKYQSNPYHDKHLKQRLERVDEKVISIRGSELTFKWC